jgi:hypothetical protein
MNAADMIEALERKNKGGAIVIREFRNFRNAGALERRHFAVVAD